MIENKAGNYIKPDIRPVAGIIQKKDGTVKIVYPIRGGCMRVGVNIEIPGLIFWQDGFYYLDCHNPNCPNSSRINTDIADPEHPSNFVKQEQSSIYERLFRRDQKK